MRISRNHASLSAGGEDGKKDGKPFGFEVGRNIEATSGILGGRGLCAPQCNHVWP